MMTCAFDQVPVVARECVRSFCAAGSKGSSGDGLVFACGCKFPDKFLLNIEGQCMVPSAVCFYALGVPPFGVALLGIFVSGRSVSATFPQCRGGG